MAQGVVYSVRTASACVFTRTTTCLRTYILTDDSYRDLLYMCKYELKHWNIFSQIHQNPTSIKIWRGPLLSNFINFSGAELTIRVNNCLILIEQS